MLASPIEFVGVECPSHRSGPQALAVDVEHPMGEGFVAPALRLVSNNQVKQAQRDAFGAVGKFHGGAPPVIRSSSEGLSRITRAHVTDERAEFTLDGRLPWPAAYKIIFFVSLSLWGLVISLIA